MQRLINLPDEQVSQLEQLAARERRSLDEVVQVAVSDYLARRQWDRSDWAQRFEAFVADVRSRVSPDMVPEEIEAEITANWDEDRTDCAGGSAAGEAADAGRR